ncbi:MAG: hypothetical protein M1817_006867 [Caeruleum heppii]|nr:MAG: hypothetical protein M1817_006867 [Caeruleum heppii]
MIQSDGQDVCLGYVLPDQESFLAVEGHASTNIGLFGFEAAVGARGVRALRVLLGGDTFSEWFGSPEGLPRTLRLCSPRALSALKVGLDVYTLLIGVEVAADLYKGFKIVSLGVLQATEPRDSHLGGGRRSLRETALWYPDIPPSHLELNESSFTGRKAPLNEYRPLSYVLFDQKHESRSSLASLSVTYNNRTLVGIEFGQGGDGALREPLKLGRHREFPDRKFPESPRFDFSIDGAHGEKIEKIEVAVAHLDEENVRSYWRYGKLEYFRVHTNRGRTGNFQLPPESPDSLMAEDEEPKVQPLRPMSLKPQTRLVGFYAAQATDFGLVSLGAISLAPPAGETHL